MQNPFLYPGQGLPLRKVEGDTGNVLTQETTVDNGEYTESIGAHDCLELMFSGTLNGAASGDILVEQSGTPDFAHYHTFATIDLAAGDRAFSWSAGEPMAGFFRLKNESGARLTPLCQKRII